MLVSISSPRAALRRGCVCLLLATCAAASLPAAARAQAFPDFVELVERVAPAVVNIRTTERPADAPRSPFHHAPPPSSGDEAPRGEGSGFIISGDGYLLTNAHVVDSATEVLVTLVDKREFKARIIGADERSDVALLKIEATGLPVVKVGNVSRLRVGEWVLAIGSPFGLDSTVTAGIVSAKQRETGSDIALLQTDVAVNPGNSGGPLIDTRGEVVGVNSQILSPVGSYIGISFAIPIDEAMRIADQLRASGRVVRGYLGIQPIDLPRELAEAYGLAIGNGRTRGAFVRQVLPGTPGAQAGIEPADLVLGVNGKPVEGAVDLRRRLGGFAPGTVVKLQINRRGEALEVTATLGDLGLLPVSAGRPETVPAEPSASLVAQAWGLVVSSLGAADRQDIGGVAGVRVAAASESAEAAGLRAGDVILAVGSAQVGDVKQFESAVGSLDTARSLPITVRRGNVATFLHVPANK